MLAHDVGRLRALAHGTIALCLLAAAGGACRAEDDKAPPVAADSPAPASDPRPIVRLRVESEVRSQDAVFAKVVEGRLISDLDDMETFRTVHANSPGDYLLICTIRTLRVDRGTSVDDPRDAESDGNLRVRDSLGATMDLHLRLEDSTGAEVLSQRISTQAHRPIEISDEHTASLVSQEMIDRAAQKIEKLLRKKLRRR